jgi:hypothetical protein
VVVALRGSGAHGGMVNYDEHEMSEAEQNEVNKGSNGRVILFTPRPLMSGPTGDVWMPHDRRTLLPVVHDTLIQNGSEPFQSPPARLKLPSSSTYSFQPNANQ